MFSSKRILHPLSSNIFAFPDMTFLDLICPQTPIDINQYLGFHIYLLHWKVVNCLSSDILVKNEHKRGCFMSYGETEQVDIIVKHKSN